VVFYQGAKGNPTHDQTLRFLETHKKQLDPALYADWHKAEEYLGHWPRDRRNPLIAFDLLTGASGPTINDLRFGKVTPNGMPLSFRSTDLRGNPWNQSATLVLKAGRISDVAYKAKDRMRRVLNEVTEE